MFLCMLTSLLTNSSRLSCSVLKAEKRFPVKSEEPIVMVTGFRGYKPRFSAVYRISKFRVKFREVEATLETAGNTAKKVASFLGFRKSKVA